MLELWQKAAKKFSEYRQAKKLWAAAIIEVLKNQKSRKSIGIYALFSIPFGTSTGIISGDSIKVGLATVLGTCTGRIYVLARPIYDKLRSEAPGP